MARRCHLLPSGTPPACHPKFLGAPISSRTPQNPNLGLFFNRTEFDDVVQRVCKSYGQHGQAFCPSPELVDYVWEITNGHPAGVQAVLDYLAEMSIDYHFHLYF
jgi:hypothetical protein